MKRALVIGASGGIGRAIAHQLRTDGYDLTGLSRAEHGLDITDERSVETAFEGLTPGFSLIFVATGALEVNGASPEKSLSALTTEVMLDQFRVNTIGPALVLKHARRLLLKDQRCVFAALSARVGSIGDNRLGGWYSYRSAKSALNQVIHTAAIEIARSHPQAICVCLHPGTVATRFTEKYLGRHPSVPPEDAACNLLSVLEDLTPDDTGKFFDWAGKQVPW